MVWERIKSVRAVAETKLIGESIESLSIFLHQTTKIKHSTQMLIYMNVASVSPHMRKATMQTEGLCRTIESERGLASSSDIRYGTRHAG